MMDPRATQLFQLLAKHSTKLKPGENVLIETFDIPEEYTAECARVCAGSGASVFVQTYQTKVQRAILESLSEKSAVTAGEIDRMRMEKMDAYIALRGSNNVMEFCDVSQEKMKLWNTHYVKPVHLELRVPKTKWVVLRWPNSSMAQQAGMSTYAFEDFYYRVCTVNYSKMEQVVQPLKELMLQTDRIKIKGNGTDLSFSIKDVGVAASFGLHNIPDGECFTAPVKESVEGVLHFNTDTLYQGKKFSQPKLTFQKGRIVDAEAGDMTNEFNDILDTDQGARYIGEWSLGFNPHILHPMLDTLFDEKIAGSFHMTPGNAYDVADNGNRSAVHWDMVCIQRPEYGGGEIWFDDKLIRKDGLFVLPELLSLNPDMLGAEA